MRHPSSVDTQYDPDVQAYFIPLDDRTFRATSSVQGAWNTEEQHIAPSLGLLAHVLERDHGRDLLLGRITFDILGTLPIDTVTITTRVVRAGRSIELVEATLSHDDRPAATARAWFLHDYETGKIAGSTLPAIPPHEAMPAYVPSDVWPGEYLTTVAVRRQQVEPGRAQFWVRPRVPLVEGEAVSTTARMLSTVDVANGITPRQSPRTVLFPNLDLTAHLFRQPTSEWIGFDTTVSFGPTGLGLTHTVLHDEDGPLGTSDQALTVRPRASEA